MHMMSQGTNAKSENLNMLPRLDLAFHIGHIMLPYRENGNHYTVHVYRWSVAFGGTSWGSRVSL